METSRQILRTLRWILVSAVLLLILADYFKWGFDSTDGHKRSGLGLYTDNMTGCQYLSAGLFGITPRLDKNGHHICTSTP